MTATSPENGAAGVALNTGLAVTFSEPIDPATLTAATFTLTLENAAIAGAVAVDGAAATFTPTQVLTASSSYTATLHSAKSLSGISLASAYSWSFTTGATADTTPPTISSTSPLASATGVSTNASVQAIFSKAMSPQSISTETFTLMGPNNAAVAGTVTFDLATQTATFQSSSSLAISTIYVAKVQGGTGGVADLAGNVLASDDSWSFTTGARPAQSPVLLGSSANYAVLAKTAISSVPSSAITGNVGISPAAATFLTGFSMVADSTNVFSTSTQVTGKLYAANYAAPTPATLTTAISDMQTGYTDAAGRPTPDVLNLSAGTLSGLTLSAGLYKWTSNVTLPTDLTLNGSATDVWILQISGDLTMSSAKNVILSGGAQSKNIFWQVAGAVDIGTGAHFEGNLLSQTSITLQTLASMNGRALAQTQVALQQATIAIPAP